MSAKLKPAFYFLPVLTGLVALAGPVVNAQAGDTLKLPAAKAAEPDLKSAEALIAAGDSKSAYGLLHARETEFAGDPYFDYLLGVAALDTGHTTNAIFSLRRSIAAAPQFSGARMELARAYFESDNTDLARPLFVHLLEEQPPANVRTVINEYIVAIDKQAAKPAARFTPYIETGAGYDSNANGSTDDQQFFGFTLSPNNVATASSFLELATGLNASMPISTRFAWVASGRASYRHNPDASFVDPAVVNGYGGFTWQRQRFFGRLGVDGYYALRDGSYNESYAGGDALIGSRLTDQWDLMAGLRGGALLHADAITVLDVNRMLYTLSLRYRLSPLSNVTFEAFGGGDSARETASPYGNAKKGLRFAIYAPLGSAFLYASLGRLKTDYDGLFFGEPRDDTQFSATLQLEFRDVFRDGLSIIPRVLYVNNDSDVALYKYDRSEVGLQLRWTPQ